MDGTLENSCYIYQCNCKDKHETLGDNETGSYDHLKAALLAKLSPDTDDHRLSAREQLAGRRLWEGNESVDELAQDLEKLQDQASPGLQGDLKDKDLKYHLMNVLPDSVVPAETSASPTIHHDDCQGNWTAAHIPVRRIQRFASLLSHWIETPQDTTKFFKCGRAGHIFRNCRARNIECFECGGRGHIARQCWSQGNARGGVPVWRAGGTPDP